MKRFWWVMLAVGLVATLAIGGAVAAQEPDNGASEDSESVAACPGGALGRMGRWMFGDADGVVARSAGTHGLVGVVAEALGLDVEDLLARVRDGESLAAIVADEGGDPEAIADALVEAQRQAFEERIPVMREHARGVLAGEIEAPELGARSLGRVRGGRHGMMDRGLANGQ